MSPFSRSEVETAFRRFQEVAAESARSGDWAPWAALFTEDATYIEHHFGRFTGPSEILRWISETMSKFPNSAMTSFPVDWYLIDADRGWVVFSIWNVMEDPGDGTDHRAANWTLLKYAGGGKWSWEEDMYNPNEFGEMIARWSGAREAASRRGSP